MSAIAEFLKHYTDEALDRLERDAEEGKVPYWSPKCCLLAHHQDGYYPAKRYNFAESAEREYHALGFDDWGSRVSLASVISQLFAGPHSFLGGGDRLRQTRLLPIIRDEKQRRLAERAVPYYTPAPAFQEFVLVQQGEATNGR